MRYRHALAYLLTALALGLFIPGASQAAKIHPDLADAMAEKRGTNSFAVLMVFEGPHKVDDLIMDLNRLSPDKRRKTIITILKRKSRKSQASAMGILDSKDNKLGIDHVTQLYFASAISFSAGTEVVHSLASLPVAATLYLDRNLGSVSRISPNAVDAGQKAAPAQTPMDVYSDARLIPGDLGCVGDDVIFGSIDSGIDMAYPGIAKQLWVNVGEIPGNGIDDDRNGFVDDVNGWDFGDGDNKPNGTRTDVDSDSKLMVCKAIDSAGTCTLGMIWAAEQYCVENGAHMISLSYGVVGEVPAIYKQNEQANRANIRNAGVTLFGSTSHEQLRSGLPVKQLSLAQNHPNPFNPSTSIVYSMVKDGHVDLAVYDLNGRRVCTLVHGDRSAGDHTAIWNGVDSAGNAVPSGMYFYKFLSGGESTSRKMVLLK